MGSKHFPLFPLLYESWLFLLSYHQQSAKSVELPFSTVHTSSWYFAPCTSLAKSLTPSLCRVKAFAEPNVSIQALCNYPEKFQQPILIFPILSSQLILGLYHTHKHTHTQSSNLLSSTPFMYAGKYNLGFSNRDLTCKDSFNICDRSNAETKAYLSFTFAYRFTSLSLHRALRRVTQSAYQLMHSLNFLLKLF